jgi:hypothetical protein
MKGFNGIKILFNCCSIKVNRKDAKKMNSLKEPQFTVAKLQIQ